MAAGPVFPGFIKIEYKTDGSSKSKFLADAAQLSGEVTKPFSEAFDSIGKMVDRVSGKFREGNFKLDIDVSSLREASAQADFTVKKMQVLRDAALQVATATNDQSESTRAFVAALQAQASAAESASTAARDQLTAYSNLQGAVSSLTRENNALAQSYRDTFLEQAKVANAAYKAQQDFNSFAAPGLDRSKAASQNGAPTSPSSSAFADQYYAPKVDPRTGLEAFLAGKGAVDGAVLSVAKLDDVLGRVQRKGPEVAAALAEVERAAASAAKERVAAEAQAAAASEKIKADAAAEMQRLAQSADSLRAELDPAVAAQNRFNAALDRADGLLKAGAIDQRTYGQAVAKAQSDLQTSWRDLTTTQEQQQRVAKQGTTADQSVINSMRSVRVAGIQAGQQLQDMAVQFQMGTNASTIMAQQLPQLGFALSGLEGNANKTLNKIGSFATFLAGPWGAAILIAGVALGPLIQNLLGFGDAADEGKAKAYDFSNGLNGLTFTANEAAGAFAQLAQEIRGAIAVQGDFLQSKAIAAAQANREFTALANRENAELQSLEKRAKSLNPFDGGLSVGEFMRMRELQANQPKLRESIANARAGEVNADIAIRQQRVLEKGDPQLAVQGKYRRDIGALETRRRASREREANDPLAASTLPGYLSGDQYEAEFARLTAAKNKAEEALKPAKKGPKGADPAKEAERAAKAAMRLGEFSEDAGKKIANIRDSFAAIPPEVERINRASRELDDIISDLMNRKPDGFEALKADAEALKASLADGVVTQALDGMAESSQRQLQIQDLLLSGRDAEATALQNIWNIEKSLGTEADLRAQAQELLLQGKKDEADVLLRIANQYPRIRSEVAAIAEAEQKRIEAQQKIQEIQSVFLDSTRNIRSEVEGILGGYGKLSDLGSTLRRSFQQIQGKILTEKLFGDMFRDMDKWVKEKTGIGSSVDMMAKETERAGSAAGTLADELLGAAQRISGSQSPAGASLMSTGKDDWLPTFEQIIKGGWGGGPMMKNSAGSSTISGGWDNIGIPSLLKAPANDVDPNGPITVIANKSTKRTINDLTPEEFFHKQGQAFGGRFAAILEPLLGKKLAGNLGGVLGGVLEGQATTGTGFGAILGGLKELKGLPKGLSETIGTAFKGAQSGAQVAGIGNALGVKMSNTGAQVGGAIGEALFGPVGGFLGGVAGGLLGSIFGKKVKSGYAQVRNGTVAGTYGRTGELQNDAAEAAGGLVDTISSLAKTLGTKLGAYDFDFGKKNDKYVVNTGVRGVSTFDSEQQAMEFAVREAVADGAFIGLKEGAKRLLQKSGDLETQVQKAVSFQNVFKQLKAIKNPVGAALDDLNDEFSGLIDIFKEAGASAAEYADLEELYGIKRKEAIDQANQAMVASLKGLLSELNVTSDYYSLRDRKQSALDVYNPLKARVAAGDTTAFDAFSDAARNLISIEREISGSTSPFFALLKEVTDLSQGALNGTQSQISTASASDSPFSALAAQNAATTSAIENQTDALLGALGTLNDNLVAALRAKVASGDTADVTTLLRANGYW